MLQTWPNCGPVVAGPHEAEIRALAVRPQVQGRAWAGNCCTRVIERAAELGVRHLVLCTEPEMRAAHHLYEQAGFVRLPERDWSPAPEVTLLVYGLRLAQQPAGRGSARAGASTVRRYRAVRLVLHGLERRRLAAPEACARRPRPRPGPPC